MKFVAGVAMVDPTFYVPIAQAAEAAGFDSVAVPDAQQLVKMAAPLAEAVARGVADFRSAPGGDR